MMSSKLNRKFQEVQKKIDGTSVGQKIAAEGKKKYLLVDRKDLPEFAGKRSADEKDSACQGGFLLSDDEDGDYYGVDSETEEDNKADSPLDYGRPSSSSATVYAESNKELEFSVKLIRSDDRNKLPPGKVVVLDRDEVVVFDEPIERSRLAVIHSERIAIKEAPDCLDDGGTNTDAPATLSKKNKEEEESKVEKAEEKQDSMKEEQFYYGSLHIDESDGEAGQAMADEDDMDNIEWQSDGGDESMSKTSGSKASLPQYGNIPDERAKYCTSRVSESTAPEPALPRAHPAMISSEVVTRAMNTASNMADWAGRAVRMALRNHMQQTVSIIVYLVQLNKYHLILLLHKRVQYSQNLLGIKYRILTLRLKMP